MKLGIFDNSRKVVVLPDQQMSHLPITLNPSVPQDLKKHFNFSFEIDESSIENSVKRKVITPIERLRTRAKELLIEKNLDVSLLSEVPQKWERLGDLVLFPSYSFCSKEWSKCSNLWSSAATALGCARVAKNSHICDDDYRQSNAALLLGGSGWVRHKENGIVYCYDVTKCMFSSGNVTEKLRLSRFDCSDEVVVDMFAGIGYFSLTYLVHCKAKLVHACEWNVNAVEALRMNLVENGVKDRCIVHAGDNRVVAPVGVADRVNLGLLPSSEVSWKAACRSLKSVGGVMEVHGNVNSLNLDQRILKFVSSNKDKYSRKEVWSSWAEMVRATFQDTLNTVQHLGGGEWAVAIQHIEHVKQYAPHIDHMVVELSCKHI